MPLANPAVSIGLPVYNGATYLATALDALLAQDFTDFEKPWQTCGERSTG